MNNFIKLYLLSSLSLSFINADTTKFGLGSCLDQDYPQPIWLKDQFDFLMIFSSIQIIAEDHPYEKWNNFPHEKEKLFNMLNKYNDKTLFVSGDRHRGGIYKESGIYEITASSLNKPGSNFDETDTNLIGKTYNQENYGSLEVSENKINVLLKDVNGKTLNMVSLKY